MKQRVSICINHGNCENADTSKKFGMTETCPLCGGDLYEISLPFSILNLKIVIPFVFAIAVISVWWWLDDKVTFVVPKNLNTAQIQTPGDIVLTSKVNELAETPYVKKVINLYYEQWKDQLIYYDATFQKFKVTPNDYGQLHEIVSQAALALEVKVPHIYLINDSTPDAYVMGVTKPILVIHSELIRLMEPEELLFVIGHELGHLKFKHILVSELVAMLYYALEFIPTDTLRTLVTGGALLTFLKWSRESEISADRLGMILVGSEEIAARALIKLMTGLPVNQSKVKSFMDLHQEEDEAFDLRKIPVLLKEATATHPFIGSRVKALYQYKNSPEYPQLFLAGDNHRVKINLSQFDK
jgi:Zn-dependent protease with chaperone function